MALYSWPGKERETLQYYQVTGTETYQLNGTGTAQTKTDILSSLDVDQYFPRFYVRGLKTSEIGDLG